MRQSSLQNPERTFRKYSTIAINFPLYPFAFFRLRNIAEYRRAPGMERLRAASTVQTYNEDISQAHLQELIGLAALMIMNLQGRSTVNAAGDSAGLSTQTYGRWYTIKYGKGSKRQ